MEKNVFPLNGVIFEVADYELQVQLKIRSICKKIDYQMLIFHKLLYAVAFAGAEYESQVKSKNYIP